MRTRHPIMVQGVLAVFRALARGFFRLDVRGTEHVPEQGGAIIAGNHPSVLDGLLLLLVVKRPVRFLVAEDLYHHRFLRPLFRLMGAIPVYRTKTSNGDALRAAVAALEAGEVIGIFPEGTIHFHGTLPGIKRGVVLLALKTGVPVVPLSIVGSGEAFPDGAPAPRAGLIRMFFHPPFRYHRVMQDPLPDALVEETRETFRGALRARLDATPRVDAAASWSWGKRIHSALCGIAVVPLARLLTSTSNPSLDTVKRAGCVVSQNSGVAQLTTSGSWNCAACKMRCAHCNRGCASWNSAWGRPPSPCVLLRRRQQLFLQPPCPPPKPRRSLFLQKHPP